MAMSRRIAFSNALNVAMLFGRTEASSFSYQAFAISTMRCAALTKSFRRSEWVASREPLPGRAKPRASVRLFIELAVNMPEHEPQVGQLEASKASASSSEMSGRALCTIASIRSRRHCFPPISALPASIGPPLTKMVGMFRRIVAISMPGVTLSQLLMQTRASAQWALHMYSTESAITSRLGRL